MLAPWRLPQTTGGAPPSRPASLVPLRACLALRGLGYINLAKAQRLLDDRRNLELRAAVRRIGS